ncbi:hypothetical protein DL96DRAFT_475708 [Flagelloscypha sp. PMI_526]|nr:hypothetical protein DL96DRAFT_475708 [Flagelloscypha sp. PMI_526]
MSTPFTVRWGVVATGNMATKFVEDLLIDPAKRGVHDIKHVFRAVASSTSAEKAQAFANKFPQAHNVHTYGSVGELAKDAEVDAVYIASPTSHHYHNALTCLNAGKAVLCEKSFTINALQTQHLIDVARSKQVYLAEALWTRYFPIFQSIRKALHTDRVIGRIQRIYSDCSLDFAKNDLAHGLRNAQAGGGALLAVGVYPLTWGLMALLEHPDNEKEMPKVNASMILSDLEACKKVNAIPSDEQTQASLVFPKLRATANLSCSVASKSLPHSAVVIQGELGTLTVSPSTYHPESYTVNINKTKTSPAQTIQFDASQFPIPGKGLFFQADALARGLKEGKLEPEECTWEASLNLMKVLDQVREQGGLRYPGLMEDVVEG